MTSTPLRRCRFPFQSARACSSTTQACLAKIINIIVTVLPVPLPEVSVVRGGSYSVSREIFIAPPEVDVNLDLRLGTAVITPAGEENERIPTEHSGVVNSDEAYSVHKLFLKNSIPRADSASDDISAADKSSEGECSAMATPIEQRAYTISDVTNTFCRDEGAICEDAEGTLEGGNGKGDEGYLDLLLEAALQVSSLCGNEAGDEDDEKSSSMRSPQPPTATDLKKRKTISSGKASRSKRRTTASVEVVAFNVCKKTEPIVRSNRGRTQVLPSRFRDSVLEPWRKPPTIVRQCDYHCTKAAPSSPSLKNYKR